MAGKARLLCRFQRVLVCLLISVAACMGRDFIEMESKYLGEGWFQYRFKSLDDPYVKQRELLSIWPTSFSGFIENVAPIGWTNIYFETNWNGFAFDEANSNSVLTELTFRVRSSRTNYRRSDDFFSVARVTFADPYLPSGGGVVMLRFDCLIPCLPEEVDGSPDKVVSRIELVKDIKIDGLIQTNREIYGISFTWNENSTVRLEGSFNLKTWSTVAQFFGTPPTTIWITNTPINSYGRFFRLGLVANRHLTNSSNSTLTGAIESKFEKETFKGDSISNSSKAKAIQ